MPIYEFQCKGCKKVFDVLEELNSQSRRMCPECGSSSVRRLISRVQTRFGKDFYEEEYKKGEFIE